MTSIEFRQANARRCDLIDRKYSAGLSPSEANELKRLTEACREYTRLRHPRDTRCLDELEAWIERLKAGRPPFDDTSA